VKNVSWSTEIEGRFWLPGRVPQKVRGVLTTSWTDGVRLHLEERLGDFGEDIFPRIYGEDMGRHPLVLTDAFTTTEHIAVSEPTRFMHVVSVNNTLLGSHRPKTKFVGAHASIDGLREFLGRPAIDVVRDPLGVRWVDKQPSRLAGGGLKIRLVQSPQLSGTHWSVRFDAEVRAELRASRGRDTFAWHQAAEALTVFIGLFLSRPAQLERLELVDSRGRRVENRYAVRELRGAGQGRTWLTAPLLGNYLAPALERWYAYRHDSYESFSMISEYVGFGGHLTWTDRLLLLARFVEVHDRRQRKGGRLPAEEHKQRVEEVVNSVPAPHKEWVRASLGFSNNLTLRERLNASIADLGPDLLPVLGNCSVDAFAKAVTDTRNYYTHYSSGLRKSAAIEWPLALLTKRLWFVVRGLLLEEMRLPKPIVAEALMADREWQWLTGQPTTYARGKDL
jgi:hypothetical protein